MSSEIVGLRISHSKWQNEALIHILTDIKVGNDDLCLNLWLNLQCVKLDCDDMANCY